MTFWNWLGIVGCFIATGLGALKGYQRYQSKKLDKEQPEKKS